MFPAKFHPCRGHWLLGDEARHAHLAQCPQGQASAPALPLYGCAQGAAVPPLSILEYTDQFQPTQQERGHVKSKKLLGYCPRWRRGNPSNGRKVVWCGGDAHTSLGKGEPTQLPPAQREEQESHPAKSRILVFHVPHTEH